MIKTIVYASDLGVFTCYALAHVEELAKQYQASVTVVHAVPPLEEFTSSVVKSYCSDKVKEELLAVEGIDALKDMLRDRIFDMLSYVEEGGAPLLSYVHDISVVTGSPAVVILDEARRKNADLIVIGSHGAQTLDPYLLGSVAGKVLQLAKVPVYMIPMLRESQLDSSVNMIRKSE